jgi:hypothetical protein
MRSKIEHVLNTETKSVEPLDLGKCGTSFPERAELIYVESQ